MTNLSSAGAVASVIKTSLLCASAWNLIFLLCCSWENSQPVPVTHARQVVKGPTGLLKITETEEYKQCLPVCSSVQLLSPSPSLSPHNTDRLTPPKLVKEPGFFCLCMQTTYRIQTTNFSST